MAEALSKAANSGLSAQSWFIYPGYYLNAKSKLNLPKFMSVDCDASTSLRPGIMKLILNGQNNLDKLMERIESKSKRVKETIPILKRT